MIELKKESDKSRFSKAGPSSHSFELPSIGIGKENRDEKDNRYCSRRRAIAGIIDDEIRCPASSRVSIVSSRIKDQRKTTISRTA